MGFFLGWLIFALDDHHKRTDEEAAEFAWVSAPILGILFYIFTLASRLNWDIPIRLVSEGWYLLGTMIITILLWFSIFSFCKSL